MKKLLCLWLCIMLALAYVPVPAVGTMQAIAAAEAMPEEMTLEPAVDSTAEPTTTPTAEPAVDFTAEPATTPTAEPAVDFTAEPTTMPTAEQTVEPTTEPTAEPTTEPTPPVSEQLDFSAGYVRLLRAADVFADAHLQERAGRLASGGVLYAVSRKNVGRSDDAVCAVFLHQADFVSGWIPAAQLRALTQSENETYVSAANADPDVRYYKEDRERPLRPVDFAPEATSEPQSGLMAATFDLPDGTSEPTTGATASATAEPAVTAEPSPTPIVRPTIGPQMEPMIVVEMESLAIGVGESAEIFAYAQPISNGIVLNYTSSSRSVVTVDATGKVTGKRAGTAKITVSADGLTSIVIPVRVYAAPTKITLRPSANVISVEQPASVSVAYGSSAQGGGVTFASSDKSILHVGYDGTLYAYKSGVVQITATAYNGKQVSCTVTVKPAPTGLGFADYNISIGEGQTFAAPAETVNDSVGGITYRSSDTAVVTVAADGTLTGVAPGTATITAVTYNGHTATCSVRVLPKPEQVTLRIARMTLGVGETSPELLVDMGGNYDGGYTFTTSYSRVATVSADGRVTAHRTGSATITVRSYNGKQAKVAVSVAAKPTSLTLQAEYPVMYAGQTAGLSVKFGSGQGGGVGCWSGNEDVLRVSPQGDIVAVAPGSTEVIGITYSGIEARIPVEVVPPAATLNVPEHVLMGISELKTLEVQALQADGEPYRGPVEMQLSGTGIVTLSEGKMTGKASGKVTVTVSAGGLQSECAVEVKPYYQVHTVKAVAHRGGCGYWPENTLEAFGNVASTGADMVELDVQTTKDGVQLVHHDAFVSVGSNQYNISAYTADELKALKPTLCTLDEALVVLKATGLEIQLEMKTGANGAACVEAVRRHGLQDKVVYISFYPERLEEVRACDADAVLGSLFNRTVKQADLNFMEEMDIHIILPKVAVLNSGDIAKYHRMGMKVGVWSLNTPSLIRKYIELGADFITSDWPDRIVNER